jgi:transposase
MGMEVLHERCAGLDVHQKSVVACVLWSGPGGTVVHETRTFGTMTGDLEALAEWLAARGCGRVAMEATGAYWKPAYNVLEAAGGFELWVVNAEHLRAVPGRKTDVKDAQWIAELLRYGLLRASFIPDRDQRELRELTRYRTALIRERADEVNRLQKTLEAANIKLAAVLTDVTGVSGQRILDALVRGRTDPEQLADLAHWRVQRQRAALERAVVAVGHSILVIIYHLLARGTTFEDLGGLYFDERHPDRVRDAAVRRIEALGYQVQLTPKAS